jgi:hypothetical protein
MTDNPAGPLDGVKVLDLCSYLAGPYGCTLLADLGADVIKIESPQGDMLRQFPSTLAGDSRFFVGTNRGKRALALDLKQPEGLAVLHRMVATADVLVENFRPSVPARLGIDSIRWSVGGPNGIGKEHFSKLIANVLTRLIKRLRHFLPDGVGLRQIHILALHTRLICVGILHAIFIR